MFGIENRDLRICMMDCKDNGKSLAPEEQKVVNLKALLKEELKYDLSCC